MNITITQSRINGYHLAAIALWAESLVYQYRGEGIFDLIASVTAVILFAIAERKS